MISRSVRYVLYSNYLKQAQDRSSTWHGEFVNEGMEAAERNKKDELKQRRGTANQEQAQSGWRCVEQLGESLCWMGQSWSL